MILKTIPKESKETFEKLLASYKGIRDGIRSYAKKFAAYSAIYGMLGDELFTSGIRMGEIEISVNGRREKMKYTNLSRLLHSLIYHLIPERLHIKLEEIGIEPIEGILKDVVNFVVEGEASANLRNYVNKLPWNEREEFWCDLESVRRSFMGVHRLVIEKLKCTESKTQEIFAELKKDFLDKVKRRKCLFFYPVKEDVKHSFSASEFTTLSNLYKNGRNDLLEDKTTEIMVLVDPEFDVHQLDVLVGCYKLKLLPWMPTSRVKVKEPLDLIVPLDRSYEPFELTEKRLKEIIEEYHFRVNCCINLIKKKLSQVLMAIERIKPFYYLEITRTLKEFFSFLEKTANEMKQNKKMELELAKLYLSLID